MDSKLLTDFACLFLKLEALYVTGFLEQRRRIVVRNKVRIPRFFMEFLELGGIFFFSANRWISFSRLGAIEFDSHAKCLLGLVILNRIFLYNREIVF